MQWVCKAWPAISRDELYALAVLRAEVFVVEQACAYLDLDGYDPKAWHLWAVDRAIVARGTARGDMIACLRLLPPHTKYAEPSIGRIVTAAEVRRTGVGRALVAEGIRQCNQLWPGHDVRIGAQRYLERFYAEFGFTTSSPEYDEDGIPHVEMVRPAPSAP